MKSYLIFPQTAWTNSSLGFAGIKDLSDEMTGENVEFKFTREYQAIVFEIENLNEETIGLIRKKLPAEYEVPALLEGYCSIISKDEVIRCDITDEKFNKLMRDAHLEVSTERKIEEIPDLSLADINKLCDDFADSESIQIALKKFDIERLHRLSNINKKFEHKLGRILVDIKSTWFALDYDLYQLGRNTGANVNARFKRYMYINNAIVRIRLLWEKLIELAILLERPDDFDKILSAKSVRSKFIKNFKGSQHPVVRHIWDYLHSIDTFEQRFRSPELHKIGRTIWWAAREKLGEETNRFIAYRNDLNRLLRNIVKEFEEVQNDMD
ncbi:hypothetical protein ES703_116076 [subsurface metagenome]